MTTRQNSIRTIAFGAALLGGLPILGTAAVASVPATGVAISPAQASLVLAAQPLAGSEAVFVSGQTLPNERLIITLLATLSPEIPTIIVSRHEVQADANGRFGAVIPVASAYERGALLRLTATSASGASATTQLVMNVPNAGVSVPFDSH